MQQTLEQFGKSKIDVDHLGTQPTLEAYFPELTKSKSSNGNGTESTTRVMFWYHPDYLGNVDLVTERDGKTYEFFTYNPWGEEMHQYNANTFGFASPYRFNSKEKDEESGLHYYGARYYQSKLSVWMSVDPLSKLNSHLTPFNFSSNNPIMRIDPNGLTDYSIDRTTGKITIVEGTETTDGLDRLIAGNATYENEKLTNSNFLEVRKGILEGGTPYTSGENIPFTLYGIVNNQEAKTMFEFVAVNSDVEWSLVNFTAESGDYNYLTTSGLVDGEAGGSQVAYEIAKEKEDGATLNSYYHSHPKSPFGVKYNWSGPSGLHVKDKHRSLNGGDGGDIGIAKKIIAHEPNAVFKIYDIRKMEYIPYDHKGIKR